MKVKTAELSGVQLDYAVAISTGTWSEGYLERNRDAIPAYSTDWGCCGPLIDFRSISLSSTLNIAIAVARSENYPGCVTCSGSTPQIAICRAVVASKLGDEVDIPDELMESK